LGRTVLKRWSKSNLDASSVGDRIEKLSSRLSEGDEAKKSPAGIISVISNSNNLVELFSESFEVACVRATFLTVRMDLLLAGTPKVLKEIYVRREGIVQGTFGTIALLSVLFIVDFKEGFP